MPLRLVFLGRLEDVAGSAEREVTFTATLDGVLAALEPPLATALSAERIRVAHNGTLLTERAGVALQDGDEIAFLPPVSGG